MAIRRRPNISELLITDKGKIKGKKKKKCILFYSTSSSDVVLNIFTSHDEMLIIHDKFVYWQGEKSAVNKCLNMWWFCKWVILVVHVYITPSIVICMLENLIRLCLGKAKIMPDIGDLWNLNKVKSCIVYRKDCCCIVKYGKYCGN